ncbi:hypothetical protein SAMN04488523_11140 [Sulfitobacter brevis]|uniref:Uncharacterized protein n=1 Tax=Sulfitobacter brevis TaxID=74348 RepID=A0A1I2DX68_9RHOB|nr:hypothetical protein [Sulfitobacter brevis]SFE85156.1 hypothetical protein SAMN04488523_11140 [Sulfitobacter brevis]
MTNTKSAVATRRAAMAAAERLEILVNLTRDEDVFLHETMKTAQQVIANSGVMTQNARVTGPTRTLRH